MSWTLDSVLSATWTLLRDNFGPFFVAALIFTAPSLIVHLIGAGVTLALLVGMIVDVLVTISLTVGAIHVMAGARLDVAALLSAVDRPDIGKVIVLGIVQHVVILLGLIALIAPGLYVLSLWMVAMPAVVVERLGVGEALNHSSELTRERRWRVLAAFAIVAVPIALMGEILEAATGTYVVGWLVGAVLATALTTLTAVLYVVLRGEKEGMTIAQIAAALD
jgi:hypothetical protein